MRRAKRMKTFDFIQMTISHNLKDPHPKALEPDCLSPFLAISTQPHREGHPAGLPVKFPALKGGVYGALAGHVYSSSHLEIFRIR